MRSLNLVRGVILLCVFAAVASCGGGGGTTQFDEPSLNDNRAAIQAAVTDAELVFTGTITAVGTAPGFWSGVAISTQGVTYAVDAVLKGTSAESSITISHVLVDGSRQAATEPGLNSAIFAVGAKLIVFAKQNAGVAELGEGWETPLYIDVDEDYGTIPWSAQNEAAIESMIATPAASENVIPVEGAKGIDVAKTLTITGAQADVDSFNALLDACLERSSTLSNLVSQIQNSEAYAVTLNLVNNEAGVFVDSFNGHKVDVKDLQDWGEGCNSRTDLCQLFGHFLQEYWHESVTGDGYQPSHATAIATENQIRADLGKTTTLTGHWGLNQGGTWYMQTPYDGTTELLKLVDGSNVGEVTVKVTAPTGLSADNSTSCQITISWTGSITGEGGYDIERKTGAGGAYGGWTRSVAAGVTSYTNAKADDGSLVLGETYCYRVRAWKTVGADYVYSAYSNEACAVKQ